MIEIHAGPAAEPATPSGAGPSWALAMWRGFRNRCPHCGEGRLFGRFLKVRETCEACGIELHHHRADDLPPYLVIFVVGHLAGIGILETEMRLDVPLWFQMTFWPGLALIASLALLQPTKGAVVGLQYALGMHGFSAIRRAQARPVDNPAQDNPAQDETETRDGRTDGRSIGS
ncbi:Uncharacterized conserved protein, DUF983 family [Methylobacterium sp. 174MFSha1.1]|uniref:DUF983 domain-containing protein n=1 Tax=Methylobacterium sp. 174MFSha1.1 TaxID=1502749 RepID=UPI0008E266DA|nr:DUF983 domain-containing protein [Methylobacterium sp. 174MFSha1.1]SFV12755.1 Uncharacterized conserved protein, DUF983 family [Methylobacterium sp. 174MFSha1.1]